MFVHRSICLLHGQVGNNIRIGTFLFVKSNSVIFNLIAHIYDIKCINIIYIPNYDLILEPEDSGTLVSATEPTI